MESFIFLGRRFHFVSLFVSNLNTFHFFYLPDCPAGTCSTVSNGSGAEGCLVFFPAVGGKHSVFYC